jgi:5-amino-6-(5-phosphoribosylamino)uracil reductase
LPPPDYTALVFPTLPDRPYVIINMVSSVDGHVTTGRSEEGLGSPADQRLMRELRFHADVVLDGAETLRISGASPRLGDPALEQRRVASGRPLTPVIATLTSGGQVPLDRPFFTATDFQAVVYAGDDMPPHRRRALAATGREGVDVPADNPVPAMLDHMRTRLECSLLLCEGGPSINRLMFDAGVVDELFLTLGPVVVGGRNRLGAVGGREIFPREHMPRLRLLHAIPNDETDEVYLRYRTKRRERTKS